MKDTTSSNDLILTPPTISYDNSPSSVRLLMTYIEATNIEKFKEKLGERPLPQKTKNNLLKKALSCYTQVPKVKEIIESLLANGADPNINMSLNMKDKDQPIIYPLMYIVETNDFDLLKIFLRYGALPNLKDSNNRNCLFYLFKSQCDNKVPMAKAVLNSSININDTDLYGFTVMMEAVNRNMKDLVEVFLDYKADVNYQNSKDENTAIHYAVKNKNIEMIQVLLKHKPNLNICNKNKDTPLDIATKMTSQTDIYTILAEHYSHNDITMNYDEDNNSNCSNHNYSIQNSHNNSSNNYDNNSYVKNNSLMQKGINNKKYDFNDCIFKHKTNHVHSRIEIPFNFHDQMNSSTTSNYNDINNNNYLENNYLSNNNDSINNSNNLNNSIASITYSNGNNISSSSNNNYNGNINQFHSYISISHTPTLYLDISNEESQDLLIFDALKSDNINNAYKIKKNETQRESTCIDNDRLKTELQSLKEQLQLKDQSIKLLNDQIKQQEQDNIAEFNTVYYKIEEQNNNCETIKASIEKLHEKAHHERIASTPDYLNKKFCTVLNDEMLITNNLNKDILDFYHLTKMNAKLKEPYIAKILMTVNEIITSLHIDYRTNVCGSYATGLNLDWSDLDIVLCPTIVQLNKDMTTLQSLFIKFKECSWVLSIKLIENHIIPLISFKTNELYGYITVNISIFDQLKYNTIMHVEYTKYCLKLYPVLEPLVLVLKQLMKVGNLLVYPGALNSYSIILMIVFFFQVQLSNINSIDLKDYNNLGRLFKAFSKFYSTFDTSNNIILLQGENLNHDIFNYITKNPTQIIIVDPTNHLNNVSEGTFHYNNVKVTLAMTYAVLINYNCDCSCHYLAKTNDKGYNNVEHCILGKIFQTVKRMTSTNI